MTTTLSYRVAVPQELVDDLRTYLSDKPEFNRLIEGSEFNDDQMKLAVRLWLQRFNTTPPSLVTKYTDLTQQDFPVWHLLFNGVMIELLIMGGIVNTRNFLNFNDGGVSFTVSDKGQAYQGWIGMMISNHQREVSDVKAAMNAEEAYDYHPSPENFGYYYNGYTG